ncbi:hypothetical protein TRICI_003144 [Trichomonascus ciferrii]|uniref:Uncharacterized protein n=1 Tax=Trichomonascus ciferrii TaxID=44093 RepID=A0A642V4T9_9ASCO|nr:hypothetical protein TRICI_003144 [Trichomonascus ciferrii]
MDRLESCIQTYTLTADEYRECFPNEDEVSSWPVQCRVFEPDPRQNPGMGARPILIRECFDQLECLIQSCHRNVLVVAGNKGVGKRTFLDYVFMKGMIMGDTYIVRHSQEKNGRPLTYLYYPGGVIMVSEDSMPTITRILNNRGRSLEDIVVLCDTLPPNSLLQRFDGALVIATSSDPREVRKFQSTHKCTVAFTDIWDRWEVVQGVRAVLKIQTLSPRVGMVYKYWPFMHYYAHNTDMLTCSDSQFSHFVGKLETKLEKSFQTDHGMIMRASKRLTDANCLGTDFVYEYASPHVFNLMNTTIQTQGTQQLKVLLNFLLSMSRLSKPTRTMVHQKLSQLA